MGNKLASLFESRRFWVACSGVLVAVSQHFGNPLGLTEENISQIVLLLSAWVVGDSVRRTE